MLMLSLMDAGPACDAVQLHVLKELTRRELLILLLDVHDAASASDDADSIESTMSSTTKVGLNTNITNTNSVLATCHLQSKSCST